MFTIESIKVARAVRIVDGEKTFTFNYTNIQSGKKEEAK